MQHQKFKIRLMAKIILFGNQKGGVGKSTLTMLTATALSQPPFNLDVCVLDADDQRSLCDLRQNDIGQDSEQKPPYEIRPAMLNDIHRDIRELDRRFHVVFIDVAGKLDLNIAADKQEIIPYLSYVDLLFMPFVAGNFNVDASAKYLKTVLHVQLSRQLSARPLSVFGLVNMFRERSRVNGFLLEDIQNLRSVVDIQFMETHLRDYALFKESDTLKSLYSENSNDAAKLNFRNWIDEFANLLNQ